MYPLIASAIVGALLMGRTKPKTKCEKKTMLGPKSGSTYTVEDFTDAGFIVVTSEDGSQGVFVRASTKNPQGRGFVWQHGRGKKEVLQAMYEDFAQPHKPLQAVPPQNKSATGGKDR